MSTIVHIKHQMFLALAPLLLGCGVAFSSPLLIAVEDDAAPWSQSNGTGFANEIVRAAFDAVGVKTELLVVPYARCKDMALKGKAAGCFSMSWIPELAGKIVFAEKPIFLCNVDYFVSNKRPLNATQEAGIPKGTVVGIVIGYEYPPSVYALRDQGIVIFEESESEELNLKKLSLGRIDAALVTHNETKPADLVLARAGVSNQVKLAFRSGINASFIGFNTRQPDGMQALKKYNEGYRIIASNGTARKIDQKWRDLALKEVGVLTDTKTK